MDAGSSIEKHIVWDCHYLQFWLGGYPVGPVPTQAPCTEVPTLWNQSLEMWWRRCEEEEEMADYFFPWKTLLDHGKPALLPSPSLTWLPKTLEMGEHPPSGGVGEVMVTRRWEGAHWGVSTRGCRSRCQRADDHPEQGVDTNLKLGWGGNKW